MSGLGQGVMQPLEVANATGQNARNPQRYEGRVAPFTDELGPSVNGMDYEAAVWFEHARQHANWLRETDRGLVTTYAIFMSAIHKASVQPSEDNGGNINLPLSEKDMNQFLKIVKLLGLTPVTRQQVHLERAEQHSDDLI